MELYKKYRPRKLSEVIGQESAVKVLARLLAKNNVPHAMLFIGPSGCGKTTLARIMRRKVGCGMQDFNEVNCADFRGIDMVREVRAQMQLSPISGSSKVWLIDECQKLTGDGQSAFLKMLEDTPDHVYFMLATTDPHKLLPTIRTRCTEIKVALLPPTKVKELISTVAKAEKVRISDEVSESITEKSEGSARKALVLLDQVINLESVEDQIEALQKADVKAQAINLARLLIQPRPVWKDVVKVLKNLEDDPETCRRLVLGYASSVLKGGGGLSKRACFIIDVFGQNFFDSGEAGLTAACYAVSTG